MTFLRSADAASAGRPGQPVCLFALCPPQASTSVKSVQSETSHERLADRPSHSSFPSSSLSTTEWERFTDPSREPVRSSRSAPRCVFSPSTLIWPPRMYQDTDCVALIERCSLVFGWTCWCVGLAVMLGWVWMWREDRLGREAGEAQAAQGPSQEETLVQPTVSLPFVLDCPGGHGGGRDFCPSPLVADSLPLRPHTSGG